MAPSAPSKILVVGAGAIGGVVAGGLLVAGHPIVMLTTNRVIADALREQGVVVGGTNSYRVPAGAVLTELGPSTGPFDVVLLAVQPPQVEDAAQTVAPFLDAGGRVVCFQNGLCEDRVAKIVGRHRVIGAVVAWGASMLGPGRYERTSLGGFTIGSLDGPLDDSARKIAAMLGAIGPVTLTENLLGARWSKLAINCAISTLGTIGGDRVGVLMRKAFARRLALEIMTEVVTVARLEGVRLEKVAGTIDLDWLAIPESGSGLGIAVRHAVLFLAGIRYRKLRSSMLAAIERGRPPAVDFLNGEVVERAERHGVAANLNRAAAELVWQIARGQRRAMHQTLKDLYDRTR